MLVGRRTLAADDEPAGSGSGLLIYPRAAGEKPTRDKEKEKDKDKDKEREKENLRLEREKEKSLKREKESRETLKGAFRSVYIARARPTLVGLPGPWAGPGNVAVFPTSGGPGTCAGTPGAGSTHAFAPNELSSLLLRVCIHKDKKKRMYSYSYSYSKTKLDFKYEFT